MSSPTNHTPPARRLWVAGTTLTALTAIATALFSLRTTAAEAVSTPADVLATKVSVAIVVTSDVATWGEFSGRLEAVERGGIRSRVWRSPSATGSPPGRVRRC